MATSDQLSAKQQKCLAALLTEPTVTAAAAKVGVGERTVHTWLSEPVFADAYRRARREAVRVAIGRLQQVSAGTVAVLVNVMADKATPAATRVNAAKAVIEYSLKSVEIEDLAARIEALEAATHAQ
jgi:hypothetical protein